MEPGRGIPRPLEATGALLLLLVLSPALLLAAVAIRATSHGPAIFRQQRVGRGGRPFWLFKLRTMRHRPGGIQLTGSRDQRVTALGRLLRKLKLDEVPALWNVVRGEMSIVGPRPEVPRYVDLDDPLWQQVLAARPGLTDPVTLRLRNEEELLEAVEGDREEFYLSYLQPFKLRGYLDYLRRRTWKSDLAILFATAFGVFLPGRLPPPTSEEVTTSGHPEGAPLAFRRLPRLSHFYRELQILLDVCVLAGAFALAYLLRYDFQLPEEAFQRALVQLPLVVLLQLVTVVLNRIHSFVWRYVGLSELSAFVKAALQSALPLVVLRLALPVTFQSWRVPLSVIFIDTVLAFGGLLALRVARRVHYEHQERRLRRDAASAARTSVLLVGAGRAGIKAARELMERGEEQLEILGFVDDDPAKLGSTIAGKRVLGSTYDLPTLVPRLGAALVILTIVEASPMELGRILRICERIPVEARIMPGLFEILEGRVQASRDKVVRIEDAAVSSR